MSGWSVISDGVIFENVNWRSKVSKKVNVVNNDNLTNGTDGYVKNRKSVTNKVNLGGNDGEAMTSKQIEILKDLSCY